MEDKFVEIESAGKKVSLRLRPCGKFWYLRHTDIDKYVKNLTGKYPGNICYTEYSDIIDNLYKLIDEKLDAL